MSDLQITLTIPEALAKRAQEAGVLSEARILALIEADTKRELERDTAILEMQQIMRALDTIEPKLSEQDVEDALREAHTH